MITLNSIDYQVHSIQIKDAAGDALAIGADGSLNVTDNGGSLTVDAVDLDIRDLAFATDKVDVSGSLVTIQDGGNVISVDDAGGSLTVDAVNLDIRDLAFATDKVDVSGSSVSITGDVNVTQGTSPWVIGDGGGSITVDAVNLDIRDLAFATDKVDVSGSSVTVSATDLDIRDLSHTQDSIKIGDGTDFLAVNADGSINVQSAEAGYSSWSVVAATVTTTESQLAASPLSGRLRVEIQNRGSSSIFIRQVTGVTTSNGLEIPGKSSYEQALDAGAAIFAIASSGSQDVRIAQYAA